MTKEYWQINTDRIAQAIRDAAARAVTEEDLKMAVEPIIQGAVSPHCDSVLDFWFVFVDTDLTSMKTSSMYQNRTTSQDGGV